MRVLLVSSHCAVGGAETFMLALQSGLQSRGHECELFFFSHGLMERQLPQHSFAHFGDLLDCLRLVDRRGIDVVHARSSDWSTGVSAVRGRGTKLIVTSHGYLGPGWKQATCDAFVACSHWLAVELQRITDKSLQLVLNGIDTHRFSPEPRSPASSPPIVAWAGRGIEARKRLDRFAAIARVLRKRGLRIWLAEPYGPEAVAKVDADTARVLEEVAEFWGSVPVASMPQFYRDVAASGGCVVSTASWEGLPLTLLEAQACGCPVFGPDVRGTNECVAPSHGGILYPDAITNEQLAEIIASAVAAPEEMHARGMASAEYVRNRFSLDRMVVDYLRVYEDAPSRAVSGLLERWRGRLVLSPLVDWTRYLEHSWSAGERQYEASQTLARDGEWELARQAARASLRTSPTLYARPRRLAHLLRAHVQTLSRRRHSAPARSA